VGLIACLHHLYQCSVMRWRKKSVRPGKQRQHNKQTPLYRATNRACATWIKLTRRSQRFFPRCRRFFTIRIRADGRSEPVASASGSSSFGPSVSCVYRRCVTLSTAEDHGPKEGRPAFGNCSGCSGSVPFHLGTHMLVYKHIFTQGKTRSGSFLARVSMSDVGAIIASSGCSKVRTCGRHGLGLLARLIDAGVVYRGLCLGQIPDLPPHAWWVGRDGHVRRTQGESIMTHWIFPHGLVCAVSDLVRVRHISYPEHVVGCGWGVCAMSRRHVLLSRFGSWAMTHPHHHHHARTGILCPRRMLGGA